MKPGNLRAQGAKSGGLSKDEELICIPLPRRPAGDFFAKERSMFKLDDYLAAWQAAVTAAFGSRVPKDELRSVLSEAGLPENVRGETLGIPQFAALAAALSRRL